MRAPAALALALSLSLPAAGRLAAQTNYRVGIGGSAAVPTGRFSDNYTTGGGVLGTLAAGPEGSLFGFRVDGSQHRVQGKRVDGVKGPALNMTAITLNLVGTLSGDYVKPYGIAGGGWYSYRPSPDTKRENNFGLNGGVGITFPFIIGNGFIESRYHRLFSHQNNTDDSKRFVAFTLGVLL